MRVAVGSMVIIILTEHQVGWAEWIVAKWVGASLAKTIVAGPVRVAIGIWGSPGKVITWCSTNVTVTDGQVLLNQ